MISLGIMTFTFRVMYDHYRHTIFEDIYGRGLVFFICATIHYMKNKNESNSVFDIKPHIRTLFFFRVIFITLAYIFLYLAILNTSSFVYVALILCVLYPMFKYVQKFTLVDKKFTIFDIIATTASLVGLAFLYNGQQLFSNLYSEDYDNMLAYIYGILCIICWSIANFILHRQKVYVHNTIDTFFVGLLTILIVPGFILCYFSMHPTRLIYDWMQGLYFVISGFFTYVFHTQFT